MRASAFRFPLQLLVAAMLGAASPGVADDWALQGGVAELWFYSIAPAALDFADPRWAWLVASLVYTLQYLALFAVIATFTPPWRSARSAPSSSPTR